MAKFTFQETIGVEGLSAKLGSGASDALPNPVYTDAEVGKIVKLSAGSRYQLAAVGDPIETFVLAVEPATADGTAFGSVVKAGSGTFKRVTLDGLQATPGTGVVAVGDYVVTGTPVAKGTKLTEPARVVKITDPTTVAGVWGATKYLWRVVEIYGATGAVGTQALIERVNA